MTERLYLVAHILGHGIAIDAAQVASVVDIGEIVRVPGASPAVRGLAALRSRVVTVIDTAVVLGLPNRRSLSTRAIITNIDGQAYAILVDSLEDVAPFAMLPLSGGLALSGAWRAVGRGIVERDGEPLLVVDLAAMLPDHAPDTGADIGADTGADIMRAA